MQIRHERMAGAGVELHVARAGEGAPVVMLHGFPEDWRSWKRQIEPLVRAGFSVFAPDLRGYGASDRPAGRAAYRIGTLVDDVAALVSATGAARAHVVGHDWGGILAWALAGTRPELVDRLVILNAPHMRIFAREVTRPPQMLRSSYVLFFQIPWLPEQVLAADNFAAVRRMLRHTPSREGAFSEEEIDGYVKALSAPGALTAALNYYRANFGSGDLALATRRVEAETLVIWGERDPALDLELLDGLDEVAPRVRVHRLPEAGHWVHREAPEEVNRAMVEFLTGADPG